MVMPDGQHDIALVTQGLPVSRPLARSSTVSEALEAVI